MVNKSQHTTPLEHALAKTSTVNFRLSKADKESMKETAKKLRLTLSEYLVSLHHYAKDKLKHPSRKEVSPQEEGL
jgi:hypothetical protein